jgi:hypothetical protein
MDKFQEKVTSMTAKEIILTMIEAVKNPVIKLNFDTFLRVDNGICYGCAATNTICKISNHIFTTDVLFTGRARVIKTSVVFYSNFEDAIDYLRRGDIEIFNEIADEVGFATIESDGMALPTLTNENYLDNLEPYYKLAEMQK